MGTHRAQLRENLQTFNCAKVDTIVRIMRALICASVAATSQSKVR